jgi:hypothetical protein
MSKAVADRLFSLPSTLFVITYLPKYARIDCNSDCNCRQKPDHDRGIRNGNINRKGIQLWKERKVTFPSTSAIVDGTGIASA